MNPETKANFATETAGLNDGDEGGKFVFHTAGQHWTVARYKADYQASLEARHFSAMFSDGHKETMLERRGFRRDVEMDAWERRWNALKLWCPEYISPVGPFDTPFEHHGHELENLRTSRQLISRVADFRRMSFEFVCFTRPHELL